MSIDAGTVYSSIRINIDKLSSDVNTASGKFDTLTAKIKSISKSTESLDKFGTQMSLKVTAPIVAASAAMVKLASDQNESLNAANVVFKDSAKVITDWGDNAAKQAGLSKAEFYQAAAVIGAGFKNAGYSLNDAANETVNLTKRAADMASIFNTDVNDAMTAMQSALRGEYEPARRFAITLSETAVSAEAMRLGLVKAGEDLDSHAKTQARLSLIMQQSSQYAGDFVNTSDQLANSTRILTAEIKNQAADMGTKLLPIVLDVVTAFRGMVDNFASLDDETQKTILIIGALAAGIGPVVLGISNAIKAVELLKVALVALSANPITLAIAGIAALTTGFMALAEQNNQRMLKEVTDTFGDLATQAGLSAEKINDVQEAMANASKGGATFEETSAFVSQIAKDMGITEDQVVAIGVNSTKVTQEYKDQLKQVGDILAILKDSKSYVVGTAEWVQKQKELQESLTKEQEKTNKGVKESTELSKKDKDQIEARKKAQEDYDAVVEQTNQKVKDGYLTQEEGEKAVYEAQKKHLDTLYTIGYASQSEIGTKGYQAYQTMLTAVKAYNDEQATQETKYANLSTMLESLDQLDVQYRKNAISGMEEMIAKSDIDDAQKKELLNKLGAIKTATEEAQTVQVNWSDATKAGINTMLSGFEDLGKEIQAGTADWGDMAKVGLNALASMLEGIGGQLAGLGAVHLLALDFAGAITAGLASAAAFVSAGVIRGYAGSFADGGIVTGTSYTGDRLTANVNSGEMILNQAQQSRLFDMLNNSGNNTTSSNMTVNIGSFIGDNAGLRELNRRLAKVNTIETKRIGKNG